MFVRLRSSPVGAVALAFLLAAGTEARAGHGCPHHDAVPGPTEEATHHVHGASGTADDGEPSPCTCLSDCQAGTAAATPAPRTTVSGAPDAETRGPGPRPVEATTRRRLERYRLHQPNAPPFA